jgi:hypothetical protein
MTTRVNIQNLSYPGPENPHIIGVKQDGSVTIVLKPGEQRELYIWGNNSIEIVEMPRQG